MNPSLGDLIILSGDRGIGKTTFCSRLVDAARQAGWQVRGVMTPALIENGQKTKINVINLETGEKRFLARLRLDDDTGIQTPHWSFDEQSLEWGNQILTRSVPCDLFIIDEIGPLELVRQVGWMAALPALDSGLYRLAIVVIRPEFLQAARRRWPQASEHFLTDSPGSDSLWKSLSEQYRL